METFLIAFLFSGFYIFAIISFGFLFVYLIYLMIQKFKNHQENNKIKIIKRPEPEKYILTKNEIKELLLSQNSDKYDCKNCAIKERDLYEILKEILDEYKIYPTKMDLREQSLESRTQTIELLNDGSYEVSYTTNPRMAYYLLYHENYSSYTEAFRRYGGYYEICYPIEITKN